MGKKVISGDLGMMTSISHHIAEIVNIALDPHRPYVGTSAFTHKAGLHTSALARRPDAYEHEPPASVGNRTRMVVSELAGKASVLSKADELGLDMDDDLASAVIERVKGLEHQGYHFEAADGSFRAPRPRAERMGEPLLHPRVVPGLGRPPRRRDHQSPRRQSRSRSVGRSE